MSKHDMTWFVKARINLAELQYDQIIIKTYFSTKMWWIFSRLKNWGYPWHLWVLFTWLLAWTTYTENLYTGKAVEKWGGHMWSKSVPIQQLQLGDCFQILWPSHNVLTLQKQKLTLIFCSGSATLQSFERQSEAVLWSFAVLQQAHSL